jgi:hypothetical protein
MFFQRSRKKLPAEPVPGTDRDLEKDLARAE